MYIIIVGGGEMGHCLARELLGNDQEVLIIEKDAKKCEHLEEDLGDVSLCGNGSEIEVLTEAGIARADMLIAATDEDEDNLAACQIAKQKFNVSQVLAKINNPRNEKIFAKLGIDHTVNVVSLVLERIKVQLAMFPLIHLLSIENKEKELVLVRVTEGSPAARRAVRDLSLPPGTIFSLMMRRGEESRIPSQDTVLENDDLLICSIPAGSGESVRAVFAASTGKGSK